MFVVSLFRYLISFFSRWKFILLLLTISQSHFKIMFFFLFEAKEKKSIFFSFLSKCGITKKRREFNLLLIFLFPQCFRAFSLFRLYKDDDANKICVCIVCIRFWYSMSFIWQLEIYDIVIESILCLCITFFSIAACVALLLTFI